jgi:hypothetical protein
MIYAFSFQSVDRPIPANAYALSAWTGEFWGGKFFNVVEAKQPFRCVFRPEYVPSDAFGLNSEDVLDN